MPNHYQQAIEVERKRIAGHLHDGLGQSLATLKLRVEKSLIKLELDQLGEVKDILTDVVIQLRNAIGEVRNIATELRPAMLDDLGLIATLHWLSRQFQAAHTDISVVVEFDLPEESIPAELKTVVFRLIQEALNNVAKHARASSIFVYLRAYPGAFLLGVVDNGVGFDPEQLLSGKNCLLGAGVNNMRDRVEVSDGKFNIRSRVGSGTVVSAEWGVSDGFVQSGLGLLDCNAHHNTFCAPLDLDLSR
jgi:two-component system NarL family sensor kinase